jgi:hypothetical protein
MSRDHTELFKIVREAVADYGNDSARRTIQEAHDGRPGSFITNENLHLFRIYRNSVTGNAQAMIKEALA